MHDFYYHHKMESKGELKNGSNTAKEIDDPVWVASIIRATILP